jgi:tetratricopeptide (TPR) repeat protein
MTAFFKFLPVLLLNGFWIVASSRGDEVELRSGEKISGTILALKGRALILHLSVGEGFGEISYPLDLIASIRFDRSAEQKALLSSSDLAGIGKLEALWMERLPYLEIPGSDTGEIGQQLVRLHLGRKTKKAAVQALALCSLLEKSKPNEKQLLSLQELRLAALLQAGKIDAALREAQKISEVTPENRTGLAEARLLSGIAATAKMKALEHRHPRWSLDKALAVEHDHLKNEALDAFLAPVVFHPQETRSCARGLWLAAELYAATGDPARAREAAREIVNEFPDPEYAAKARDFLEQKDIKKTKENT